MAAELGRKLDARLENYTDYPAGGPEGCQRLVLSSLCCAPTASDTADGRIQAQGPAGPWLPSSFPGHRVHGLCRGTKAWAAEAIIRIAAVPFGSVSVIKTVPDHVVFGLHRFTKNVKQMQSLE